MPIQSSLNSGWIFDSWEPSTEETSNNPNEDVLTADLASEEHYMRYIWSYQRHMIVQSPDAFTSVFHEQASAVDISSSSGDRIFIPPVYFNQVQNTGVKWKCVRERLTVENAGDGTFRLEQEFQVISDWGTTTEFTIGIIPPTSGNRADTADPSGATGPTFGD
jgi:hypothetical protein